MRLALWAHPRRGTQAVPLTIARPLKTDADRLSFDPSKLHVSAITRNDARD